MNFNFWFHDNILKKDNQKKKKLNSGAFLSEKIIQSLKEKRTNNIIIN